jgi:hypothetical protein
LRKSDAAESVVGDGVARFEGENLSEQRGRGIEFGTAVVLFSARKQGRDCFAGRSGRKASCAFSLFLFSLLSRGAACDS